MKPTAHTQGRGGGCGRSDAAQYEADLEANLSGLLERFKSGRYRAPVVRRVHLEKPGTSKTRPIGIPTLEDKILQRAVLMVLEPVYERTFSNARTDSGRGAAPITLLTADGVQIDLDMSFFGSVDICWTDGCKTEWTSDREVVERRDGGGD